MMQNETRQDNSLLRLHDIMSDEYSRADFKTCAQVIEDRQPVVTEEATLVAHIVVKHGKRRYANGNN